MKRITLLLTILLFAFTMMQAQDFKVLLVDDDNYGNVSETDSIEIALTDAGYTWAKKVVATTGVPTFEDMEQYDVVLWYIGGDQTTHLWKSDVNENSTYNDGLIEFARNGGIVWVDGLEYLYDIVGTPDPDVFSTGTFINDTLGIHQYLSRSHSADDSNQGVPQYDKVAANSITTINPINWVYSTMWNAEGLEITATANPLYEMMGGTYPLAGHVTALYNQVGNSTFITTGFRLGKVHDQTMINTLVSEILNHVKNNWDNEAISIAPATNQTISINTDGVSITAVETVGLDSREWKYSTTSGSGYVSFGTPVTTKSYTPNFASAGTYYVVCETTYGSTVLRSNEVQINVTGDSNSIAPTATQFLLANQDGNQLTVTENPAATSREWKYSTTSGSGYQAFTTSETATTYTPNFSAQGTYYVVCESVISGNTLVSNEVKCVVDKNTSDYYLEFDGDDSFYIKDDNQDYINIIDNWTIETWVKVDDYTAGTYPVIMDRDRCFSLFVQADGTDDFSIAFVTRDANDDIVQSLSSADDAGVDFNFHKWYHIAVQYDGMSAQLYINGVETASSANDFSLRVPSSDYINIACRYRSTKGYERFLTGAIENIQISEFPKYPGSFTPDFYAQQQADGTSVVCLNLENNTGTNLYDASGHFASIYLKSSPNNADWKLKKENTVTPSDAQNIIQNTDGNELTVAENGLATSREWKFTTTSGSGYTSFGTPEQGMTYTPNFSTIGTYYVVCQTVFNGTTITSNEVEITVLETATITTGTISGSPFLISNTTGASVDVPYTVTGDYNVANNFTAYLSDETGDFTTEVSIGTLATSTTGGTISAVIPAGTTSGTGYRIRVKSDNPIVEGTDNGVGFEIVQATSTIAPVDIQNIQTNEDGTQLTVTENPTADSREWKYSMTSGSGYESFSTSETGTTYTPNFALAGVYYVVCESTHNSGSITVLSNEVQINVTNPASVGLKVLLVDDDNNTPEADPIETALTNSGYVWSKITTSAKGVPSFEDMEQYDMVIWYTGNDGTTNLWDGDNTFIDQLEQFADNGGIVWVDGLDFLYDNYPTTPVNFAAGDFVYDKLGISDYLSQSHVDDGTFSNGVQQYDIVVNPVTTQNPIDWVYASLWFADGLATTASATPMYKMGPAGYDLEGQITALYNELGTTTYITSGFRLGKLSSQILTDRLIFEVLEYARVNWDTESVNITSADAQTIYQNTDGTALSANESDGWDSREWKFSTTSGSGYTSFATPETAKTYTPNFATVGTYYVICETTFGAITEASNEVEINVLETPTITTGTIEGSPFTFYMTKEGVSVDVPYTITGVFDAANNFKAYLSDENGDFASEVEIGTLASATAGTIPAEILLGTPEGTAFRIRVKSDNPEITGTDNGVDLEVVYVGGVNGVSSYEINIYPNPSSDVLYFDNSKNENFTVQIFDNIGRLVSEKNISENSINISNLVNGIYTIVIKNDKFAKRSQFVKK